MCPQDCPQGKTVVTEPQREFFLGDRSTMSVVLKYSDLSGLISLLLFSGIKQLSFGTAAGISPVASRFVTTGRLVNNVTKRAVMPARFVTNEVETNRADIASFFPFGYHCM